MWTRSTLADDCSIHCFRLVVMSFIISVTARPISEGAAPCSSALPELLEKKKKKKLIFQFFFNYLLNVIAVFVFSDSRCKNAYNCLQICAYVFINHPQNCAKTSFHSRAGLYPYFGRSRVKVTWSFAL